MHATEKLTPVRLSVIVPCFNDGHFLRDAIASVEHTRQGVFEIVIVDDGSTDPLTLSVLDELDARGYRLVRHANQGLGASRNAGIAVARGCYILPLDADNRIRPDYIERGIAVLDQEPATDVVYGDAEYFGGKTGRWSVPDFTLRQMLSFNFIDACAVFRKSAWERCGGYDAAMPVQGYEDWDFWLRIALTGGGFHHLPHVMFDYRVRAASMSSVMSEPKNTQAVIAHIHRKKIEITVGQYAASHSSWELSVETFRKRPFRTLARLMARAYFPKLRAKMVQSFHPQISETTCQVEV